jgi:hypothetical protein
MDILLFYVLLLRHGRAARDGTSHHVLIAIIADARPECKNKLRSARHFLLNAAYYRGKIILKTA